MFNIILNTHNLFHRVAIQSKISPKSPGFPGIKSPFSLQIDNTSHRPDTSMLLCFKKPLLKYYNWKDSLF